MIYTDIPKIIFTDKQNIPWKDVEHYLKKLIGKNVVIKNYGDVVHIGGDFPDEYSESKYTKKLRGALAKAKANAAQVIEAILINAENRRWIENKNPKHSKEASGGWYRYDVGFSLPVSHNGKTWKNIYSGTAIVRIKENGLFLYDIINIKKEASTPL